MRAYITGSSSVSPQATFDKQDYLNEIIAPKEAHFTILEPDYKTYIDPKLSRRMAKIIKMSTVAAKSCLAEAGIEQPGAIIVGTGLGCLQDTEKFLADLIENNEGLLSPTAFIQSTHNTIAGQIALILACPHHNFTFVQRGHSFETALQDALLQIEEGLTDILVGGVDEVTPTLYTILEKLNCTERSSGPFQTSGSKRPVLGEGASFFTLSKENSERSLACLEGHYTFYNPESSIRIQGEIKNFMKACDLSLEDLDVVMMGFNGDKTDDNIYQELQKSLFPQQCIVSFKNLCGEYFTASAFGHHLAVAMVSGQQVFPSTLVSGKTTPSIKKLLFYNHYKGKYHTLSFFSQCQPL